MQSTTYIAITALIVSFCGLVVSIVSAVKNFKKSKRLEFFQRRDLWSQKISELNVENSQTHLISARIDMVVQKLSTLKGNAEHTERINKQITSIKRLQEGIQERAKVRDESIDDAHSLCSNLKFGDTAPNIERLIALAHGATDEAKRRNEIYLGSLHILESTEPLLRADLDKLQQYEMQLAELNSMLKKLDELVSKARKLNEKAPG